jgi:uncharacterized coiled-coil protein SlyX
MSRFDSMRRVMGGFVPRPPEPVQVEVHDRATAAALRRVEVIGRLILSKLKQLEKTMADQNVTVADILAATKEQQTAVASMGQLLQKIHDRVNQLVAGQIDAQTQANINEAFAEIKGNTNAIADAVTTYTPDAGSDTPAPPTLVPTSIDATSSKNPAAPGDDVTMTATVNKGGSSPESITGSVLFSASGGLLAPAVNLDSTGVAAISTSTLPAGDNSITISYSGDANFAPSTGTFVQSIVAPAGNSPAPAGQAPAA